MPRNFEQEAVEHVKKVCDMCDFTVDVSTVLLMQVAVQSAVMKEDVRINGFEPLSETFASDIKNLMSKLALATK